MGLAKCFIFERSVFLLLVSIHRLHSVAVKVVDKLIPVCQQ